MFALGIHRNGAASIHLYHFLDAEQELRFRSVVHHIFRPAGYTVFIVEELAGKYTVTTPCLKGL